MVCLADFTTVFLVISTVSAVMERCAIFRLFLLSNLVYCYRINVLCI